MLEKHHIVFKSQGGMDYELNYKYLTNEEHRGNYGPHKCRDTDLRYKIELQKKLEKLLTRRCYSIRDLVELLGLKEEQANKAFKKLLKVNGIEREDALRKLMGGRLY